MNGRRFTNTRDLDEYIKCILSGYYPVVDNEKIEGEDAKFETVMLALRTARGLDCEEYRRRFGSDFSADFHEALVKNADYLEYAGGCVRIRPQYLFVQNEIIVDFLR